MTPAYLSSTTGRLGGKEETRARYKSPHRTSWATLWEGGKWVQEPVILFGYDGPTQGNQVEGKLLTLFFFWMPSGKQKQRETQQVFCESWRNIFVLQGDFSVFQKNCCKLVSIIYQLMSKWAIFLLTHCKSKSYYRVSCQHFIDNVFEDSMLFLLQVDWLQLPGSLSSVSNL